MIVTLKGESIQPCEHGLVENLHVCVCIALLNSSIKAVFQVKKPASLGVAKNHTERYCQSSASWFQAPGPPRQLLVIQNGGFQKAGVKSIFVSAVSAFY